MNTVPLDTLDPDLAKDSPATHHLLRGREALQQEAWNDARVEFEASLALGETPEALEGLGLAAWWLDEEHTTFQARERSYHLYRERGDHRGAARLATWLAWDYTAFRGEPAVAGGWIQRAHRLLEGLETSPEHGWLALRESSITLFGRGEMSRARDLAAQASRIGHELGLFDLEVLGLALEGLALVGSGGIVEGMPRLDESAAAVLAGELTDRIVILLTSCYLMFACGRVRDYDRAAQWCNRLKEMADLAGEVPLFAVCRTQYADVLAWRGAWPEAEAELIAATRELAATRPGQIFEGAVRLAELRRRQGRLDEAAELLDRAGSHLMAMLGRAALALDRGETTAAVEMAERYLRHIHVEDRTERADALALLVGAYIALGDAEGAKTPMIELRSIADAITTGPFQALACFAEGQVALSQSDYAEARRKFEDAIDLFQQADSPYQVDRSRIELAKVLCAIERGDSARRELSTALESLHALGAAPDAERAQNLLAQLDSAPNTATHQRSRSSPSFPLTEREVQVLRLVAQGLSNQEIAAQLVLSEHTVHRHIANILNKLNAPSRAAAVAQAVQSSIL